MNDVKPTSVYQSSSTRTVAVFHLDHVKEILGVDDVLAIYRVGDRVEVVTASE